MKSETIQQMKDKNRLVLTRWQYFWHYFICFFILIPTVLGLIDLFKYYVTHTYSGVRTPGEMAPVIYLPLIPAVALYFLQRRRLRFRVITVETDTKMFMYACKETGKKLKWEIVEQKPNLFVAKSDFQWRSFGELITIIWDKDRILFSSICDPDSRPSVFSGGMNRVNYKTFVESLEEHLSAADKTGGEH